MIIGGRGQRRALVLALFCAGCHDRVALTTQPPTSESVDAGSCGPWVVDTDSSAADDRGCEEANASPRFPLGVGYPDEVGTLDPKLAYLTFDDGPADWTGDVLDILKAQSVPATFFVTAEQLKGPEGLHGSYVDADRKRQVFGALVKRAIDEGHALGNHTVHHPDLGSLGTQQLESELDQNEWLVNTELVALGSAPRLLSLIRPPYGSPWYSGPTGVRAPASQVIPVAQRVANHGLNMLWNIDSTDSREWAVGESYSRTIAQEPSPDAPAFEEKVARIKLAVLTDPLVKEGAGIVVLMHDTHPTTRDALPAIIDGLRAAGYSFETMEQYAMRRWQRSSSQLTPGPGLYSGCLLERDWGCLKSDRRDERGEPLEVCGRIWAAYRALGGASVVGEPIAQAEAGALSQSFERGVVELHPENPPPCNIVIKGQ